MQYHAPSTCPVCSHTMSVTRLNCNHCGTEISGSFVPCPFCTLEERHMRFIEAFLKARGSIKEVEKTLGVSYPTVRNMMESALEALGWAGLPQPVTTRELVLEQLANGEIDVNQAIRQLDE